MDEWLALTSLETGFLGLQNCSLKVEDLSTVLFKHLADLIQFLKNHAVAPWNFQLRFISLGCIRYCHIDSMCPTGEAFPLVLPAPFSAIAGESCQHAKEWCFLSQGQW